MITGIDIRGLEPVDNHTKEMLLQSVSSAIAITTNIQEKTAQWIAEKSEQEAKGQLEKQKMKEQLLKQKCVK